MIKLRVFVSSVQKELADERRSVKALITSDPFLDEHCVPILYEDEPSMLKAAPQGYLNDLAKCQIYLMIIGSEYGTRFRGLCATHHEYHFAQKRAMPILACIRGDNQTQRDPATKDFIAEIRDDGHKYHRFLDLRNLQRVVLNCLARYVKDNYHVAPSPKESAASLRTVATTSRFDQHRIAFLSELKTPAQVGWGDISVDIARQIAGKDTDNAAQSLKDKEVKETLLRRGLLWLSSEDKQVYCSPVGVLLLAKDPAAVFPQCCVRLLAFQGKDRDPKPVDFLDISAPIPRALEMALQFVDKNTRHPLRVVGMRRLRLDEYPVAALREAIINAMAHRNYEDVSRKIHIELFKDRAEVISPGLLSGGVTLAQMRSGKVRPCSRNPVLAQALRHLGLMEEMGTGVRRMKQAMLDHGLDPPAYSCEDRCFVVRFRGPGENASRLRTPVADQKTVPSIEDSLNARQRKIMEHVMRTGSVTNRWCRGKFDVVYDTAYRDIQSLVALGLLAPVGEGRNSRYIPKEAGG